jgi:hypothetical protein
MVSGGIKDHSLIGECEPELSWVTSFRHKVEYRRAAAGWRGESRGAGELELTFREGTGKSREFAHTALLRTFIVRELLYRALGSGRGISKKAER